MTSNYVIDVYVSFWSWHVHGSHSVCLLKLGVTLARASSSSPPLHLPRQTARSAPAHVHGRHAAPSSPPIASSIPIVVASPSSLAMRPCSSLLDKISEPVSAIVFCEF
jgi:hypothetical protein